MTAGATSRAPMLRDGLKCGAAVAGFVDVGDYPALFTELARRGYSQADLEKIASRNMLRVMRGAEAYALAHRGDPVIESFYAVAPLAHEGVFLHR